jgi:hypothetical protein
MYLVPVTWYSKDIGVFLAIVCHLDPVVLGRIFGFGLQRFSCYCLRVCDLVEGQRKRTWSMKIRILLPYMQVSLFYFCGRCDCMSIASRPHGHGMSPLPLR